MQKLIDSLNILERLKDFFESNKIPTLIYLVFLSICVIIILHMDLSWAYYFLSITFPALFTKISMVGIDFISPAVITKFKRFSINRRLNKLRDYEKELIRKFIDADDTVMTLDKNYKCEGLIKRGVFIIHENITDGSVEGIEKFKSDKVLVEMDRKAFIKVMNNPELLD